MSRTKLELENKLKEMESDLLVYQNPETRRYILMDINAIKHQLKELEERVGEQK